jgi:hypothetical protein
MRPQFSNQDTIHTSISLGSTSHVSIKNAMHSLQVKSIYWSEQEIIRRCLAIYLKCWKGRGEKSGCARRYSRSGIGTKVRPISLNQLLYLTLWARAIHAGVSISRMAEVAIRIYLPRLVTSIQPKLGVRGDSSSHPVQAQTKLRVERKIINYSCITHGNRAEGLSFTQNIEIRPMFPPIPKLAS